MLVTVAAFLVCRSPAFFECTVTTPTVRNAGHDLGTDHLVMAAGNKAWTPSTAMFGTETLSLRGSGAVRHRARLLLVSAVSVAMRFFRRYQTSGAAFQLALPVRSMFAAETSCCSKSSATFYLAHFRPATTVLDTPSPCIGGRGALFPRAGWFGTVLAAETTSMGTCLTSF